MISDALAQALRKARRVVVLTGAGISAESGVPTFRDAQTGLWSHYDPMDLATPEAFRRDPKLVWSWYQWRRELIGKAAPNPGHRALVELERRIPEFTLVTQNVDGLHRVAGSDRVLELHGNIRRTKRLRDGALVDHWEEDGEGLARCPETGDLVRPDVVWFGETLPQRELAAAVAAARSCDVCLSIGTSALVYPAASIPVEAVRAGAFVAEINPEPTDLTGHCQAVVAAPAGQALPALVAACWPGGGD